ncbi:LPXTG cell wall anchor domain-containing protein [Bacillus cereus]|uniref:LPXTG-domain-containing protein cell wall anchor domain n=2 Tax=Bacillus cereus group TaxID=86661 RepID=A0A9W5KTZ8_BACCE|nr:MULTISPECIES: LPXTG cell wall anchor domain-containing protein [Bacillus cereus group]MRC28588.1 LPXTG cell wall anchor domain-containing protein [Bacillus thuringiensis]ANC21820.1 cell wall anchor protein [Bacillus cereus]EEM45579.1 Cell surface protein [Bacillus thuringiensis serovar pakistani str. T13001]EJR69762.1 LPXTG-domain-containing protein cell wall anchor domain [Bacillus cereus VD154]KIU76646.1 Cell surface protein [Bacillus thuringiensis Sbt003]
MKKIVGIIVSTVICVPFLMANVVTATSANSKAGITFSNSYTPNTSTDPTKINTKQETVDKNKNGDKYLPKTGGQTRDFKQYIGLFSIVLSLYVFKRIRRKQVYSK